MPRETRASTATTRLLATTARRVGASLALDETLDAVACAVVEALGFRSAVVNLLGADDSLHVVAVAGNEEVRTALLGTHSSRKAWEQMLASSIAWGELRFLDHRSQLPTGTEEMQFFVPDLPVPDAAEEAGWHPQDGLFAPLVGSKGALLGVLSVDDPVSGRLPTDEQLALLEVFAVHASL